MLPWRARALRCATGATAGTRTLGSARLQMREAAAAEVERCTRAWLQRSAYGAMRASAMLVAAAVRRRSALSAHAQQRTAAKRIAASAVRLVRHAALTQARCAVVLLQAAVRSALAAMRAEEERLQREAEEQARHEEQARLQREAEEQARLEQLRLEEEDRERARLEAERELAMRCVQMQGMLRRVLAMQVFLEDRLKNEAEEEARKHAAREAAAREWKIQSAAKAEFPKFLKTRIVELMIHPKNKGVSFADLEARLYTELLDEITARIEAEEEGGAPIQPQLPSIARQGSIDPKRPKAKAVTPTTHCTTPRTFRLGSLHRRLGSEQSEPMLCLPT